MEEVVCAHKDQKILLAPGPKWKFPTAQVLTL